MHFLEYRTIFAEEIISQQNFCIGHFGMYMFSKVLVKLLIVACKPVNIFLIEIVGLAGNGATRVRIVLVWYISVWKQFLLELLVILLSVACKPSNVF